MFGFYVRKGEKMYCVKCGKQLEDDWVKCPYCGMEVTTKGNVSIKQPEELNGKICCAHCGEELEFPHPKSQEWYQIYHF